jgi:hypothetical protein
MEVFMARRKLAATCNPFHARPYTDYFILHWLILHDDLQVLSPIPEAEAMQKTLWQNYGNGLSMIVQACLRAEATTEDDILFEDAGLRALQVLKKGFYRDAQGNGAEFHTFFLRSRGQLIQLSHIWNIPINRRYLRTQEWLAVADFGVNADIAGSDFFEYVMEYGMDAARRLAIFEARQRSEFVIKGGPSDCQTKNLDLY